METPRQTIDRLFEDDDTTYVTFTRSCLNWSEFASAPKHVVDTGLTYAEAKDQCAEFNSNRSDRDVDEGTKMEFTAEDSFDFDREERKGGRPREGAIE